MLDISKQNPEKLAEQGYRFEIVIPELDIKDVYFTVIGEHSKTVKDYGRNTFNTITQRNTQKQPLSLEEMEAKGIEAAAVRLIAWENVVFEGKPLECNDENKKLVLSAFGNILVERIMEESANLGNFGKALQAKPSNTTKSN